MDSLYKEVETIAQMPELVLALDDQALGQVTFAGSDIVHGAAHQVQWAQQDTQEHAQQQDDQHHSNHSGHDGRVSELAQGRVGDVLIHCYADVPVDRGQAVYVSEGQDLGLAGILAFTQVLRQPGRVRRVDFGQRLHHQ